LLASEQQASDPNYKRHQITESGISPRAFPGQGKALVVTDSDEHDEAGHLIEDAETRTRMMDKRLRKLTGLSKEISPPELYGSERADILLIGWGSTCGAIREAADILKQDGAKVSTLYFSEIWPFPAESVSKLLDRAKRCFVIENNAVGQFARLIRTETGKKAETILKYDGRSFTPDEIVKAVKEAR
jgi:2-oxoglutarate ferredoxin oxidoreductase subunit alpha